MIVIVQNMLFSNLLCSVNTITIYNNNAYITSNFYINTKYRTQLYKITYM